MKKLTILLALVYCFNLKAEVKPSNSPTLGTMAINAIVIGGIGFCVYDYINGNNPDNLNKNGIYSSFGIDPKMLYQGGFDNTKKIGYQFNDNRIYIGVERFKELDYSTYSVGYDRVLIDKKLSLSTGFELYKIVRDYGKFNSVGVNVESAYHFGRFAVGARINDTWRPDISKPHIINGAIFIQKIIAQW